VAALLFYKEISTKLIAMEREEGKNKYSKEFSVPEGFDEILRGLTREILRSQPEDISKFGECRVCCNKL
jgi:hypothetical protein